MSETLTAAQEALLLLNCHCHEDCYDRQLELVAGWLAEARAEERAQFAAMLCRPATINAVCRVFYDASGADYDTLAKPDQIAGYRSHRAALTAIAERVKP